ncbi:hypothetical protein [Flavobacterium reichenbachii]|uniref:Uncharacterized protein n=1 Tax=Flavobacterium reichenbachii TaxID=362418 RepID=A0A085ZIL1_9FLAO|nr:hypothetical protein [Flavobacterium reichenbachii]KFF04275.1 hypothetical protein IW19_01475 [Flavobacterium reichenbachii]OXB13829.1 hypothetical protein B0A68_13845 [Flavobacterium reichenbachii]
MEKVLNSGKTIKKRVLLLAILVNVTLHAQKEANNWAFGYNGGLTWNTTRDVLCTGQNGTPDATLKGLPTNFTGVTMQTDEGCFSISDSSGNLQFYSDGSTVWNKNNAVMANGSGLAGNWSSAQSGIIFPYPGHAHQYIAVTIGLTGTLPAYSVIDMTLNGGLGGVIQKNASFSGQSGTTGESLTAIKHANGTDYWVIAPGRGTTTMNAWLVTAAGVQNTTPVKSVLGINTAASVSFGGYMRISPDGSHFAWGVAPSENPTLIFGDFNASTGVFSNVKTVSVPAYGVEFSRSGKYLYLNLASMSSSIYGITYAIDFNALLQDPTAGFNGKKQICKTSNTGAIQLAPDGRLYIADYMKQDFFIVDNPEEFDNLRVYKTPVFITGTNHIGLPSFSASWFVPLPEVCYVHGIATGTSEPLKTIISTLDRVAVPRNYADYRTGSLILESNNKGFVLTRISSPETAIANPVTGMLVYDTTVNALKLYNGTGWKLLEQACPDPVNPPK